MTNRPVFFITRMVPTYRIPVLERLNERLGGRLVVCHGEPPGTSTLSSMTEKASVSYRRMHLTNYWLGRQAIYAQDVTRPFREYGRPAVVLAEESPGSLSLFTLLVGSRAFNVPIVLWGHFSSNSRLPVGRHPVQQYRFWMARTANACVCYTEEIRRMLADYVPSERLFTATNTLDIDTLFALRNELVREGRDAVRQRLGLPTNRHIVAFVGRLEAEKGVFRLADILAHVEPSPALVVIGEGPEGDALRSFAAKNRSAIYFTGALSPEAAAPYLFASDVVLLPGTVGLAVNHAFAMGRPIVTERSPGPQRYHGPEVAYLRDGVNAVLAPHADDEAMATAVQQALLDRERLSKNALDFAMKNLRPDDMVEGIVRAIEYADQRARRSAE